MKISAILSIILMSIQPMSVLAQTRTLPAVGEITREGTHYSIKKSAAYTDVASVRIEKYRDMLYRHLDPKAQENLSKDRSWKYMKKILIELKENGEHPYVLISKANEMINEFLNYSKDPEQYKIRDYFASPSESMESRDGDCEDFAILKYYLLKDHFDVDSLYLAIVKIPPENTDHMILAVSSPGDVYLLDNRFKDVQPFRSSAYSFTLLLNENGSYHIKKMAVSK